MYGACVLCKVISSGTAPITQIVSAPIRIGDLESHAQVAPVSQISRRNDLAPRKFGAVGLANTVLERRVELSHCPNTPRHTYRL